MACAWTSTLTRVHSGEFNADVGLSSTTMDGDDEMSLLPDTFPVGVVPDVVVVVVVVLVVVVVVKTVNIASSGYRVFVVPVAASMVVLGRPCVNRTIPPRTEIFHGTDNDVVSSGTWW